MIKAVIFDADGVLINANRFSLQLEKEYGIPTEQTLSFFDGVFEECLVGKAELREVIEPKLKEWGWKGSTDELLAFWFKSEHNIDEEVLAIVNSLKEKLPIFMATNQEKCRADYMRNEMGFGSVFKKIYVSADLGHQKTNQEFFRLMLEDIHENFLPDLQPNEILFFDDSEKNIESAKGFGIQTHLYSGIEGLKKELTSVDLL